MDQIHYRGAQLHVEDVALAAIAEAVGTPTYVYSRSAIEENFTAYRQALQGCEHLICYAVKANSNLAVLNVLAKLGSGFDIVSEGELERVVAAGGDPGKIVFSGVAKTRAAMARALELGIYCFNLESSVELDVLNAIAEELGTVAPVSVRVNPDVDAGTHPYISTGLRDNKFGIAHDQALAVYQRAEAMENIRVSGLDCHIGSQLTEIRPFVDALHRLLELVNDIEGCGIKLQHLDLGGGLGVNYKDETPPAIADYVGALRNELGDRQITLLFEPGRSIVANAGVLLTRVDYLKDQTGKNFAIVDAAMNDMIRPALYQAWLNVMPVDRELERPIKTYDVVGPVCESGDFLARERELALDTGDLLAVAGAGAYGFVMSSNYNSRPRAAEIMVDGVEFHTVRRREVLSELYSAESMLPSGA
ncbi:MAG: diaminopimelate decarboxylase [Halieaceae bacterium]